MTRDRAALAALAAVSLLLASSSLGAQTTTGAPAVPAPTVPAPTVPAPAVPATTPSSGFTLTPHVGYTTYSDIAELSFRGEDPTDPTVNISGSLTVQLDAQPTFGVTGVYQMPASPWGMFADFSRSGGDATLRANLCFVDPSTGLRDCFGAPADASGSQWRLAAGVSRRTAFGSGTATLSLGGVYGSTHFEMDDEDLGASVDADVSSPGVLLGAALEFPLSPRIGIHLRLSDAVMRVSDDEIRDEFLQGAGPAEGVIVDSDPKFVNAFGFGAGVVLRF